MQRYASRFPVVEINSSFYRSHKPATYARWAESTPTHFRFSVKIPKEITHDRRLVGVGAPLDAFFDETAGLGAKLGCVLIQLPPSLAFHAATAQRFLASVRRRAGDTPIALEPRHASWFEAKPSALLERHRVARVAADPACVEAAALPGGDASTIYVRLHGSPHIYKSSYDEAYLRALADMLTTRAEVAADVWCIFDNTARNAATDNALALLDRLAEKRDARTVATTVRARDAIKKPRATAASSPRRPPRRAPPRSRA